MKTEAAILWRPGEPIEVARVDLAPPQAGEVLVKIAACGVCATDLHVVEGELPEPLPLVLGHEASGVVEDVGPGVESLAPGDHVVLVLVPSCGACAECRRGRTNFCEVGARMAATGTLADGTSRLSLNGTTLHHFNSVSGFASHAVVPESVGVRVRDDVTLDTLALLGCAVLTGYGSVVHTAEVPRGATVAVWGCGGVGANIVQAARLAGAAQIVAVDVRPEKLDLARSLGATDVVRAAPGVDVVAEVKELTDGGPDYAFEAIGTETTIAQAWAGAGTRGTVIVVGILPKGSSLAIDPWEFFAEKTLKGSFLGSARIREDVPRLADLCAAKELLLDPLVDRRIPLADLPDAFERLRAGDALRQLVVFDS
jgi:S-(hydroxymethyl)glutathione dehydrogenase / alcohol dehydrogenase